MNFLVIPHDKALHALYGLVIYNLVSLFTVSWIAITAVLFVAIGKEIYDYYHINHTSDGFDVLAAVFFPLSFYLVGIWL